MLPVLNERLNALAPRTHSKLGGSSDKFAVGSIIPDIVTVFVKKNEVIAGEQIKQVNLTYLDCAVLSYLLSRGKCLFEVLRQGLSATPERLATCVKRLSKLGFLRISNAGEVSVVQKKIPSVSVVSIEAKLARWKDAITQAESYRVFSNYSYMALPQSVVDAKPEILDQCKSRGVGLIAVSTDITSIVLRPPINKDHSPDRLWIIGKLLKL